MERREPTGNYLLIPRRDQLNFGGFLVSERPGSYPAGGMWVGIISRSPSQLVT